MKILHTLEIQANGRGVCALSNNLPQCLLAFPASNTTGEIMIFDAMSLSVRTIIPAHSTPIACLAIDKSGTYLASASTKGTVVRVFNLKT